MGNKKQSNAEKIILLIVMLMTMVLIIINGDGDGASNDDDDMEPTLKACPYALVLNDWAL